MRLFKKKTVRYVHPPGHPDEGKRCKSTDPGAVKRVETSRKWYVRHKNAAGVTRDVPLAADKAAARSMARDLEVGADRERAGLTDPHAEHATRPLADHLDEYADELRSRDRTEQHIQSTLSRCRGVLLNGCGFRLWADIDAGKVGSHLADRRRDGLGAATSNHYKTAVKMFSAWMVAAGRAGSDPLARLRGVNPRADVRKERRAVSGDELGRLLAAAAGRERFAGLPGPDRAVLYLTAALTGLRASELASLTPRSFDLKSDPPTVTVGAAYSKRRRRDVQPIPPALVGRLGAFLDERRAARDGGPDAPVWGDRWAVGRAAEMLRADLDEAGIDYEDEHRRHVDFHSLRHTYITSLADGGVHPKDAQTLARHSTITLTMDRYTHADRAKAAAAVRGLTVPDEPTARHEDEGDEPTAGKPKRRKRRKRFVIRKTNPGGSDRTDEGNPGEPQRAESVVPLMVPPAERVPAGPGGAERYSLRSDNAHRHPAATAHETPKKKSPAGRYGAARGDA